MRIVEENHGKVIACRAGLQLATYVTGFLVGIYTDSALAAAISVGILFMAAEQLLAWQFGFDPGKGSLKPAWSHSIWFRAMAVLFGLLWTYAFLWLGFRLEGRLAAGAGVIAGVGIYSAIGVLLPKLFDRGESA
ncbi:MAG: hypothetical protein ABGW84_08915 [Sphingomonadaceae bacterium]|jgi:hypothetical protein